MAGEEPPREPFRIPHSDKSLDLCLIRLINYFQHQLAKIMMKPADFRLYSRLTFDYQKGRMPYDQFARAMAMLLGNKEYADVRVWWHTHHMEVTGKRRMVDNESFLSPLALFVTLNSNAFEYLKDEDGD